jgi:hypothetical protein
LLARESARTTRLWRTCCERTNSSMRHICLDLGAMWKGLPQRWTLRVCHRGANPSQMQL